ncbi:hypothetical protein LO80_01445 [Candidatus Francisella endociliophora]|uniref:DUF4760 domain-containing protein n=1 Tax=Candidatus Francisella endociliophora TaxID=653937 RepID=A0A097EMH0_9GAMM|nr:hypothetical protein [Francisella sp. FSC1006]AIT08769.1 hypothetical protein LO80_01445 [Francisella sp. FSC1006]
MDIIQITSGTSSSTPTFVAVAALIISIITIFMTRNNISFKIRSELALNNRQAWINEYRKKTSKLIMLADVMSCYSCDNDKINNFKELSLTMYSLMLMLNKKDNSELYELIEEVAQKAENLQSIGKFQSSEGFNKMIEISSELVNNRKKLFDLTHKMLKNEWKRIKKEAGLKDNDYSKSQCCFKNIF